MKKVTLKPKPQAASPDDWVSAGSGSAAPSAPAPDTATKTKTKVETSEVAPTANAARLSAEAPASSDAVASVPMKRLTIDIPSELHTRVKMQCAARGRKMADEIRLLLEERFGADAAE